MNANADANVLNLNDFAIASPSSSSVQPSSMERLDVIASVLSLSCFIDSVLHCRPSS